MSRTRLHTELGKCKNGIIEWNKASRKTKKHCDRHNFDIGEMKERKIKIKEKTINKELKSEL